MITNKKILIFGGSGSLGHALINRYLENNTIVNYSRDECKHWKMSLKFKSDKLSFIIGDIRDYNRVETSIIKEDPDIIIIAAALKHIDRCEYAVNECALTNFSGPMNVANAVEKNQDRLTKLSCVVFVSTDKATSPINTYGICKALSEKAMIEKSLYVKNIKFVTVRYGNILNSNGSIIQILNTQGTDNNVQSFTLTDENMTRFIMTLDEAVDLIQYSILNGDTGDIIVPHNKAMKIRHLIELFSEKYNKPLITKTLRPGEKIYESLINEPQSMNTLMKNNYYHIKPFYISTQSNINCGDFNSTMTLVTKEELKQYLLSLNLL